MIWVIFKRVSSGALWTLSIEFNGEVQPPLRHSQSVRAKGGIESIADREEGSLTLVAV